jgi:pyruvate/2-oxoglutarate dehydrogenase complex dihydrolipoamide acyltransferase (E2) component
MKRALAAAALFSTLGLLACSNQQPAAPPAPPPAAPPPAPAATAPADSGQPAKPKMVANPDGLSLADRMAKRQAAEKKLAEQNAAEEHDRVLAYDKTKLALHKQVWADIQKYRAAYGHAKTKADVEKIRAKQQPAMEATGKKMSKIDEKGGNSNVVTDYDVMMNALANDYPDALEASFDGDKKPLEDQNAELDKRTKKINDWLAEVKSSKPAKAGKKK